ncbi:hypothetical protein LCGC14_3113550, partial [marine sediment metagenome]
MIDRATIHRGLEEFGAQGDWSSHMGGHMVRLFEEVMASEPTLIVELGIGWGSSSHALGTSAGLCGAEMIGVDLNPCPRLHNRVRFVQSDDLEYAKAWTRGPIIDVLMIDTNHTYDQTENEVRAWLPHLRPRCKIMFHDTNAQPHFEAVARYLRDWLAIPFPEGEAFEV